MRLLSTSIAAACLAALSAEAASAPPVDNDFHITADHLEAGGVDADGNPQTVNGDGHVRARHGAMRLRGIRLFVDLHEPRAAWLHGSVYGVDGLMVLMAHKLRYDFPPRSVTLTDGRFAIKRWVRPKDLYEIYYSDHPEALWDVGQNAVTLKAERLIRTDGPNILADKGYFTTCACPEGCRPMLSFTAPRMNIVPGEVATMYLPILRLFDIPVLPLPWFQVPLSDRRTGLLFPTLTWTGPGGIDLMVPVFITLGRSLDLTVSLHYFGGTSAARVGDTTVNSIGVQGFGAEEELRWRPRDDIIGKLHLFNIDDTSENDTDKGKRGPREALQLTHTQKLLGGRLGVNLDLVSDNDVLVDSILDVARRNVSYLRSWAEYSKAIDGTTFSIESNAIQDLRPGPFPCGGLVLGPACGTVFARTPGWQLPAVMAPVARVVVGQLLPLGRVVTDMQLTAEYEHQLPGATEVPTFLPTVSTTPNGLPTYALPAAFSHTPRFVTDLHLVETVPLLVGRFGTLVLSGSERAQLLTIAETGWRSGAYADLLARSRIARTYASGWIHDIVPSIRVRGIGVLDGIGSSTAFAFSNGLFPQYPAPALLQSDLDMALPQNSTVQSVARISTSVSKPGKPLITVALELHTALAPIDAGQLHPNIDLWAAGLHWTLDVGYDLKQKDLTGASLGIVRPIGLSTVSLSAAYVNGATDDQIAHGLDVLFTPRGEIPPPGVVIPTIAFGGATNLRVGPLRIISSVTVSKPLGSVFTQSYAIQLVDDVQSCGKISLSLIWTHQVGQPYAIPIPTPDFQFENSRGLGQAVNAAASGPGY